MNVTPVAPRGLAPRRSALRRPVPRRSMLGRLAAAGAAVAFVLAPLGAGAAVAAATPTPSGSATPSAQTSGVEERRLILAPAANGVLSPGADLAASVALRNDTPRQTSATTVSVALGDQPLADRSALTSWIDGRATGVPMREIGVAPLDAVAADAVTLGSVRMPGADPVLAGRPAGVYPLLATATVDGEVLTATSAVVVPDAGPATGVGVVVPLTAPPISRGLLSADALTTLTAADGALTAALDAVDGTPAILAVDPAIPAAIRVLGDGAPTGATAWLDRLLALPNARFALQFGDADLATQVHAGLPAPLQPTSLASYLPTDAAAPSPEPAASAPSGTAADEGADVAALTSIGDARPDVYWPLAGTAGPDVVSALGAQGSAPVTLVPSSTTRSGAGGGAVAARGDAGGAALLVHDSAVSELASRAASATDTAVRGAALAAATAQVALADPATPLLVALERDSGRSRVSVRAAVEALASAPGTTPLTLDQLLASPASPIEIRDAAADTTRVGDLAAMRGDEEAIARFATILDDPGLLTGRERAEVLQLLGTAWRTDAEAAHEAIETHRAETVATLDAVGILASGVNLVSYASSLLPYVRNDLPWPVTLTVAAQPDDARLVVQSRTEVRVQPEQNARVEVPVQAEIANGQVTVEMRLFSPTGEPIGAPQAIGVDVHAEWETIGLVILSILFVAFIGVGIARTVLRRRAARGREASE